MRHAALALSLSLIACIEDNPAFTPPDSRGFDAGEVDVRDLRRPEDPRDLRRPEPDLGTACKESERRCRPGEDNRLVSQLCRDGRWTDDRRCPQNSGCDLGYCRPPPRMGDFEGKACKKENDCFLSNVGSPFSCQPFVRLPDGAIEGYCAIRISQPGTGYPGTQCRPADGTECRSGFCDYQSRSVAGRDINFCFRLCDTDRDCPDGARFCREAEIVVEQVIHRGRSCIPVP